MFITVKILDHNKEEKTVRVNPAHIAFIAEDFLHMSNAAHFQVMPESMNLINSIIAPKERIESGLDEELSGFLQELHKLTGGKGTVVYNAIREKKLKFLLNEKKGGLTKEQLTIAATNIGKDAFLQGSNDGNGGKGKRYGDIDYLLRPEQAARWAEAEQEKKRGMF